MAGPELRVGFSICTKASDGMHSIQHQDANGRRREHRGVRIPVDGIELESDLFLPAAPAGIVILAHGAASSRQSARTAQVAERLQAAGFATLRVDLLAADEGLVTDAARRFDAPLLARRLSDVADWVANDRRTAGLAIGCAAANTAGAAALMAAVARPEAVQAVVSRGGGSELVGDSLDRLQAPALLIVGGMDEWIVRASVKAMSRIPGVVQLDVLPGESRGFRGPGALEAVTESTVDWFEAHLGGHAHAA